jgi:hypothetical protein
MFTFFESFLFLTQEEERDWNPTTLRFQSLEQPFIIFIYISQTKLNVRLLNSTSPRKLIFHLVC